MPYCSWCGRPLTGEGRFCAACGAPQAAAQAPAVLHQAQQPSPLLTGQAPPPPGARRPFPGWAVALFVVIALCMIAALAAFALPLFILGGIVSSIESQAPVSPAYARRTPFPAATTSMSEGRSGLRIVSVVPPPAAVGPWTGADVIVAYLPLGAPVVPSRCRLTVNGRRQGARIDWVTLSPAQPILIFSWTAPYPPGAYRFRVTVVARGGKTAAAEWTYTYR
jgi:hypothetical protein